jgi:hypothetical protein
LDDLSGRRLLVDYPKKQQDEILDILFKPNYAASLQVLKVEARVDLLLHFFHHAHRS